ncbi:MAG: hypothetical protein ACI4CS_04700, partial [Candidatus Weimeria sp.]
PLAEGMFAVSEKNPGDKTIYLKKTIDQHLAGPDNAGSDLGQLSEEEALEKIADKIKSGAFKETTEEYQKKGLVRPGCRSFVCDIPGNSGVIDIDRLPEDTKLYTAETRAGSLSVVAGDVPKEPVNETQFIYGTIRKAGEPAYLITFFPGPMEPAYELEGARLNGKKLKADQEITVAEAKALGVKSVKYIPDKELSHIRKRAEEKALQRTDTPKRTLLGDIKKAQKELDEEAHSNHSEKSNTSKDIEAKEF